MVVVGGGLAGMAAAARLAKLGHPVQLFEATDRLGGTWAVDDLEGVPVDAAPSVLNFPAPWRDLFRKSGRPLEAELSRLGLALVPAGPARYAFADGTELVLPTERGEQYAALTAAYGEGTAARWRDLLDSLDDVWQAVRPLGLEAELRSATQLRAARSQLRPRRTVADLAAELGEPHLGAIVASVAHRLGSEPAATPAWCAVDLAVQRTFGRWVLRPETDDDPHRADGRSSMLVEALAARLTLRRVTVHLGSRVGGLVTDAGRVTGVRTVDGSEAPAAAVVCTVDPWTTYAELLPGTDWRQRRALRSWVPAGAPQVQHRVVPEHVDEVTERVQLSADGVPTVTYRRPLPAGTGPGLGPGMGSVETVHDHRRATPRRSAGLAWRGFGSWQRRPPVTGVAPGMFLAGPFSPGGAAPWAVVLSGALAAYGVQEQLGS